MGVEGSAVTGVPKGQRPSELPVVVDGYHVLSE